MTGTSAFMDALKLYLDPAVFGTLGLMSVLMFGFVAERMFYLSRVNVSRFDDIYSLEIDLTRHLTAIASIGANAPYVGLLGTVFGILLTFYDLGQNGAIDAAGVMLGLALALKATAAGLLVAIPAMLFYNGLGRRVEVLIARWKSLQESRVQAGAGSEA